MHRPKQVVKLLTLSNLIYIIMKYLLSFLSQARLQILFIVYVGVYFVFRSLINI